MKQKFFAFYFFCCLSFDSDQAKAIILYSFLPSNDRRSAAATTAVSIKGLEQKKNYKFSGKVSCFL